DFRKLTMAMCLSRPHFPMMSCHSAIERPYFFSTEGKYDAGPVLGHRGDRSLICNSLEVVRSRRTEKVLDPTQARADHPPGRRLRHGHRLRRRPGLAAPCVMVRASRQQSSQPPRDVTGWLD